jgi:hypothetical protein
VIELVIDELVVRGLSPEDARVAAAALEARLGALAGSGDADVRARAEAFRRLGPVSTPAGSPAALGESVAGAVWGAVSGVRP